MASPENRELRVQKQRKKRKQDEDEDWDPFVHDQGNLQKKTPIPSPKKQSNNAVNQNQVKRIRVHFPPGSDIKSWQPAIINGPRRELGNNGKPSPIVALNIGGHLFTTTLSSLRKYPGSRLSDLFNGQPRLNTDASGRYFIDRDGTHFGAILEFLRTDRVPKEHVLEVHKEAVYYDIKPLIKQLEATPQLFGETVGRQQFISRVPNYKENIEVLIRVARAEAIASRYSNIIMCVMRTEEEASVYSSAISSLETDRESVVTFGPWKANPTVVDLLDCIRKDVEAQGYTVAIQPHKPETKGFMSKCYDCFYKLTFTWW